MPVVREGGESQGRATGPQVTSPWTPSVQGDPKVRQYYIATSFQVIVSTTQSFISCLIVVTLGIFERRIVGEGPCSSWSVIKLFQNVSYHTLCTSWSHRVSLKGERRRRTFLLPNCPLLIGDLEMPRVVSLSLDLD